MTAPEYWVARRLKERMETEVSRAVAVEGGPAQGVEADRRRFLLLALAVAIKHYEAQEESRILAKSRPHSFGWRWRRMVVPLSLVLAFVAYYSWTTHR